MQNTAQILAWYKPRTNKRSRTRPRTNMQSCMMGTSLKAVSRHRPSGKDCPVVHPRPLERVWEASQKHCLQQLLDMANSSGTMAWVHGNGSQLNMHVRFVVTLCCQVPDLLRGSPRCRVPSAGSQQTATQVSSPARGVHLCRFSGCLQRYCNR